MNFSPITVATGMNLQNFYTVYLSQHLPYKASLAVSPIQNLLPNFFRTISHTKHLSYNFFHAISPTRNLAYKSPTKFSHSLDQCGDRRQCKRC